MEKMTKHYEKAMNLAIKLAREFEGSTAPNPPVGCVLLDAKDQVLCGAAHERAGLAHAEINALQKAKALGVLSQVHSLVVTLEPCSHTQKKTPPCAHNLATIPHIQNIVIGCLDPNPMGTGQGVELLKKAGKNIILGIEEKTCFELIRGFHSQMTRKRPWIIIKRAFNEKGSMLPNAGQKTFTSQSSLVLAHELRKKTDAILTGIGTVLTDAPLFTVRMVPDFPNKKRILAICEGKRKTPEAYLRHAEKNGFTLFTDTNLENLIQKLSDAGVLQLLVEAGPNLSESLIQMGLWDESYEIRKNKSPQTPDSVIHTFKEN